ncbi:MAG: Pectate lyase superfamily protein [Achromobacter mucicolens]|jgi:hypothetical protein|uniref:glycosyl hydrolase family 28-related protein n=1 Tax=Achromobacter mucicolens TaxID=1389922 RepID=UPI00242B5A05|nr:glycosyl hydrolase family 28-related protein [Achromobacter mucicolens]MDF2860332.1 Pectate lyase superfamily protein [Achromobacter mucicolens]
MATDPISLQQLRNASEDAQDLERYVNDDVPALVQTRLGGAKPNYAKLIADLEQQFEQFLLASGYQDLGEYAAGLNITARNQIFSRAGELWRANAALTLPYTTTGNWGSEGGNFVAVGDAVLRQQLAESGGSGLVSFLQQGTGAVSRPVQAKLREWISITDYGAVPGGAVDNTASINAALAAAFAAGLPLFIPRGVWMVQDTTGQGGAIINPGVSMYGASKQGSMIIPGPSHPSGSHIMLVKPAANVSLDFWYLKDFMIYPGFSGTIRGSSCIYVDTTNSGINAGCVEWSGLHLMPSNGYSIQWINSGSVNAQGNPSNSIIRKNSIWDGMAFTDAGDNIRIVDNAILSSAGSFHVGIVYNGVYHAGGVPAGLHVARNASNCDGGFIVFRGGHMLVVEDNNYEQSKGTGTGNGSIIDIQGDISTCGGGRIVGNAFGVFGTTTASSAIRIGNAVGMRVDQNRVLAGITLPFGVVISSGATDTVVGSNAFASLVTNAYSDSGIGTRGVYQALTPNTGFTNTSGGQAFSCFKDFQGQVRLGGLLDHAGLNTPGYIGTLPAGKRPFAAQTFLIWSLSGGTYKPAALTVLTTGELAIDPGGNTLTRLSLAGVTFLTSPTISSNV